MISTVKQWDGKRGFGFINNPDGGPDIFVHYSAVMGSRPVNLRSGEQVEFEVEKTDKGLRAAQVIRSRMPVGNVSRQTTYTPRTRE